VHNAKIMVPRNIFILFTLLMYLNVDAQELVRKTQYLDKSDQLLEEYYILKGFPNSTIMHGKYISYYRIAESDYHKLKINDSIRIKEIGYYDYNIKQGHWTYFSKPMKIRGNYVRGKNKAEGDYLQDIKIGYWNEIDETGKENSINYKIYIDTLPKYNYYWEYPDLATRYNISGNVIIKYKIEKDCSINPLKFVEKLGYGCDKEAVRQIISNLRNYDCDGSFHLDTIKFNITK
jgi:hypothetical protein